MNKIIAVSLLLLSRHAWCDSLIDAINQHDIKRVSVLLQQGEYNPTNYTQYKIAAQKSLEISRDALFIQKIKPGIDTHYGLAGVICFVGLCYQIYQICNIEINFELTDKSAENLRREIAKFTAGCLCTGICFGIGIAKYDCDLEDAYQDAVRVQQLISQLPYVA